MLILASKARQANEVFGHAFSWISAFDAVADVYNGVSSTLLHIFLVLKIFSSSSGRY